MQQITGHFAADTIAYGLQPTDGAFTLVSEQVYNVAGGADGNIIRNYEFNSALATRVDYTTHGKQKGVKFIIKVL